MAKNIELQRQRQREWYQRNKERLEPLRRAYRKENKPRLMQWFIEYKMSLECMRCGENHPACLQFHHREPSEKIFSISAAVRLCINREDILMEISKCDVLCGNCHVKEHYKVYGGIGRVV